MVGVDGRLADRRRVQGGGASGGAGGAFSGRASKDGTEHASSTLIDVVYQWPTPYRAAARHRAGPWLGLHGGTPPRHMRRFPYGCTQ